MQDWHIYALIVVYVCLSRGKFKATRRARKVRSGPIKYT